MRSNSARMVIGVVSSCVLFAVATLLLGGVGLASVRSATSIGQSIVHDDLAQAGLAGELGRAVATVFSTSQEIALSTDPADRVQLDVALHEQMIPAVQDALANLRQAHADSPAELASLTALDQQWAALRALLDAPLPTTPGAQQASSAQISTTFHQLTGDLDAMANHEDQLAAAATAQSATTSARLQREILLTIAAVLVGISVNAWVGLANVRRNIRPARLQSEFADTMQLATDEDEAHHLLQKHLERTIPGSSVTVLNRNNSADRLQPVTPLPAGSPLIPALEHAEPRSCLAVRSGRPHDQDQHHPALLSCPVCADCPGRSSCLPLTVGGEVIGSVLVNQPTSRAPLHHTQLRDTIGQAAPVLANLRNLAVAELRAATDALTALPNKRAVTDTLKRMLAQAARSATPMALLMLDLDHFKNINDRYGHPIGDQALAGVGAALRAALRDSDFSGRNGGEEFTVILPETDTSGAINTAERIRSAIAEITIPGTDVHLTASVGIAIYPDHGTTTERLERLADAALYVAKRTGRNRIEIAAPTDPPDATPDTPALTLIASTPEVG